MLRLWGGQQHIVTRPFALSLFRANGDPEHQPSRMPNSQLMADSSPNEWILVDVVSRTASNAHCMFKSISPTGFFFVFVCKDGHGGGDNRNA